MGIKTTTTILTSLFLIASPMSAGAFELTIPEAEIDAFLQEDGNVQVEESFTYDFEGEFNGVVRALNYPDYASIENLEAFENGERLEIETEEEIVHRIHRQGEDESFTVDLQYTIEDGVELYNDLGEFYWAFFDSSNETDYESMQIRVHPPEPSEEMEAIGYDEAENSEQPADEYVLFDMGHVESGENGDVRAAFDAGLFEGVTRTAEGSAAEEIQQEEEEREEAAAAAAERRNFLSNAAPIAIPILALLFLSVIYVDRKKYSHLKQSAFTNDLTPGAPALQLSMPATMYYVHPAVTPEMLTASLLDLVRQDKVTQEGEESFRLESRENLMAHERILVSMLFDDMGKENVFRLSDMSDYLKNEKNYETFETKKIEWQKAVSAEKKEADLKINKLGFKLGLGAVALLPLALGIVYIVHGMVVPFILLLALYLFVFGYAAVYQPRTEKGWKLLRDWKDYKDEVARYEPEDWKTLPPEEQKIAFIYGLGLNLKSVKKMSGDLTKEFSSAPAASRGYGSDIPLFMTAGLLASTSFQSSSAEAASSFSASSSGGIGGGGGVGGGGGGSGGF
ncbi:DUF2207 domain-containing protein [Alkalicoccus halolimnae]|uniref:DUF2207 domain-containing protein n=1 Tax=Alkalicoccus halolimnae TaxID=1667239 RepID=A0A5C7FE01_9BACI|nr:DUF2207 domain-containing protein [Alkalicoccus halolimnae]TXF83312.1 DUF2207 domain-containing protein [Alkalicoccus halolimnae]